MKARDLSIQAHESIKQRRKYSDKPYYTHVIAVAEMVASVTDDVDVISAAYLHDVLEDVTPVNSYYNKDWIKREFGVRVLNLVLELTNIYTKEKHPSLNRRERKHLEALRISNMSDEAKLIKRADLHHNSTELDNSSFSKIWLEEKSFIESLIGSWDDTN